MTTITPFAAGSYLTTRNASQLQALKGQLNDLTNQLSSGQVSQTYGGLGSGRSTALSAQATLSALTGYAAGITAAQTRTNLAVTSLTQVSTLGTSTGTMLQNGLQSVAANSVSGRSTALANLQTALDTLNESAAGNYLFGGSNTTTQPVVDSSKILDGTTDARRQQARRALDPDLAAGHRRGWARRATAA
ncbi:flagellin [Methylobacterium oryzae CBMB20]